MYTTIKLKQGEGGKGLYPVLERFEAVVADQDPNVVFKMQGFLFMVSFIWPRPRFFAKDLISYRNHPFRPKVRPMSSGLD